MDEVDIGKKGETWFVQEANNSDLLAHSPSNGDQNGWDFFVEHPKGPPGGLHSGLRLRSLIQVKTTSPQYKVPKLKLSALIKLAETPIPAFVLHLHHDGRKVVGAQLYHINSEVMKFAAVRKSLNPGKNPDVAFKASWKIQNFFSIEDYNRIMLDVCREAGGYHIYTHAKISQAESVGFDMANYPVLSKQIRPPFRNACLSMEPQKVTLCQDRFDLTKEDVVAELALDLPAVSEFSPASTNLTVSVGSTSATLCDQAVTLVRDEKGELARIDISGDTARVNIDLLTGRCILKLEIDNVERPIEGLMHRLKWLMLLHDKESRLTIGHENLCFAQFNNLGLDGHRNIFFHPMLFAKSVSTAIYEQFGPTSVSTTFSEIVDGIHENFKVFRDLYSNNVIVPDDDSWFEGMGYIKNGLFNFKGFEILTSTVGSVKNVKPVSGGVELELANVSFSGAKLLDFNLMLKDRLPEYTQPLCR